MKFGIDSDGNYGYIKAGADSVTPFSNYWCGIGTCNIPIELPFKPKYIMAMAETLSSPRFSALRWDSESGDYYVDYYTSAAEKNRSRYTVNVSDKTVNIAMANTKTYYMFAIG